MSEYTDKIKTAEEIARKAHRFQPYRDHKGENDFYTFHLQRVREHALNLCSRTSLPGYEVEITALLHDILEDTPTDKTELEKIFGEKIVDAVERLTLRENEMSHEVYFKRISENELARVVKAADRIANVSALNGISDQSERMRLFNKYNSQQKYFRELNIFPEEVEAAFKDLNIRPENR